MCVSAVSAALVPLCNRQNEYVTFTCNRETTCVPKLQFVYFIHVCRLVAQLPHFMLLTCRSMAKTKSYVHTHTHSHTMNESNNIIILSAAKSSKSNKWESINHLSSMLAISRNCLLRWLLASVYTNRELSAIVD